MPSESKIATRAVRASLETDEQHGAVIPPLFLSSNYTFAGFDEKREYDYTRSGNPTRDALADALTELEGGAGSVVTSSGMAAINLVMQLLKPGELVIAQHDCYGGTYRLLDNLSAKGHFNVQFVDLTDSAALEAACKESPAMFFVETPSNPLLRITDIQAVTDAAKRCGALVAVDNTFLSPVLQQPISLGADLVVHSTTKYLNGHSDVVGGAVVAATEELAETLCWWANCLGITGAPFDSYLTLRGIRTLHTRMRQHVESAGAVAELLAASDGVSKVYYPGLEDHDGHALASRQQHGAGGMLSFELEGGVDAVRALVENLEYFSLAESLGGVESLVCHPATMSHAAMAPEARVEAGISDSLVRLSVGLESTEDLIADLTQALEKAKKAVTIKPVAVA